MGLNHPLPALCAVALLACSLWALQSAQANFGSADGFSGVGGVTCTSCHLPPHPTQDDAQAHLEGLPAAWKPGQRYTLTLRVTGGPDPMPAPAPQGGFDVATDSGSLSGDPAAPALFRNPSTKEITYTAEGTLRRAWTVVWQAPGLEARPAPAHFWLAVLAANGNHVVAANQSDGGETLDSTSALTATVPAHTDAIDAWNALPLAAPRAHASRQTDGIWRVEGEQGDANATAILFRLDGGPWARHATATSWRLSLPGEAGQLDYRSEGDGRMSPVATLSLSDTGTPQATHDASGPRTAGLPGIPTVLACILLIALRRRP